MSTVSEVNEFTGVAGSFSLWREHLRDVIAGGWMNGWLGATLNKATKCQETLPDSPEFCASSFEKGVFVCLTGLRRELMTEECPHLKNSLSPSVGWLQQKKGRWKLISYPDVIMHTCWISQEPGNKVLHTSTKSTKNIMTEGDQTDTWLKRNLEI